MSELSKIASQQIIPSRSKYQMQNFVINQHDTPQMQYQQILIEGADLTFKIRTTELELQKTTIEIERLRATGDEIDAIEADKKELGFNYTQVILESTRYELKALEELFAKYPHYSYEDIEADQENYWNLRLTKQAELDVVQARDGISVGNLSSMLMTGMITKLNELENK
jgi:hypothetical protein